MKSYLAVEVSETAGNRSCFLIILISQQILAGSLQPLFASNQLSTVKILALPHTVRCGMQWDSGREYFPASRSNMDGNSFVTLVLLWPNNSEYYERSGEYWHHLWQTTKRELIPRTTLILCRGKSKTWTVVWLPCMSGLPAFVLSQEAELSLVGKWQMFSPCLATIWHEHESPNKSERFLCAIWLNLTKVSRPKNAPDTNTELIAEEPKVAVLHRLVTRQKLLVVLLLLHRRTWTKIRSSHKEAELSSQTTFFQPLYMYHVPWPTNWRKTSMSETEAIWPFFWLIPTLCTFFPRW